MKKEFLERLKNVRYSIEYYQQYIEHYNKLEKGLNIFLGVTSTGSLAGLFIKPDWQFVLTIILAVSQIISSAKPYLWFERRASELDKLIYCYELMLVDMEKKYRDIEIGKINTEEQISKMIFEIDTSIVKLQHEYMVGDVLPKSNKYAQNAKERAIAYMNANYGGEEA